MEQVLSAEVLLDQPAITAPESIPLPSPVEMGRAAVGFAALGTVAALGMDSTGGALYTAPSALLTQAGALLLTGPALLVGHQFLGLEASVPSLVDAMARAFVRTGIVALGMVPVVLYFSATSGLGPVIFGLTMVFMGANGLFDAVLGMRNAERDAERDTTGKATLVREAKMSGLGLCWALLTALIGLRIAFGLGAV